MFWILLKRLLYIILKRYALGYILCCHVSQKLARVGKHGLVRGTTYEICRLWVHVSLMLYLLVKAVKSKPVQVSFNSSQIIVLFLYSYSLYFFLFQIIQTKYILIIIVFEIKIYSSLLIFLKCRNWLLSALSSFETFLSKCQLLLQSACVCAFSHAGISIYISLSRICSQSNIFIQLLLTGCRNLEGSLLFLMRPGRVMLVCLQVACKGQLVYTSVDCTLKLTFSCSVSSMFPKSTHETFSEKLYQTFKSHKRFIKPKLSRTDFAIAHYAGEVI